MKVKKRNNFCVCAVGQLVSILKPLVLSIATVYNPKTWSPTSPTKARKRELVSSSVINIYLVLCFLFLFFFSNKRKQTKETKIQTKEEIIFKL